MLRFLLRAIVVVLALTLALTLGAGCYARAQLRASLPVLDGRVALTGLSGEVTIARDGIGVPTITGGSRADVARALGFVHAQDRYFQMDLQRRQPAGELSGLVGARAIEADRQARLHRLRHTASLAYERADDEWRALLDAYAAGVNAGLDALGAPPFEYLMLRTRPEPWKAEDSILTILAMYNTLQGRQAGFEQTLEQMRAALPEPLFRYLALAGSDWETPSLGAAIVRPPVPGPDVVDLRGAPARKVARAAFRASASAAAPCARFAWTILAPWCTSSDEAAVIGSNNWAVDGAHSEGGAALLANDMHLSLGVPNIWYRASMAFPEPSDPLETLRLNGITLPGLPVLVVGSNGFVAWGFTNTAGDWNDLVRIDRDPRDASLYLTPQGPRAFDISNEEIAVHGEAAQPVTLRWTIWGPVVWTDADGREYAQRWVAHDPDVLSSDISRIERVRTVDEGVVASAGLGIPNQNVAMADRTGRIAWTIAGVIPRRLGFDGFIPVSWADGTRRWDGYLEASESPRIVDPEVGRVWTANAPVVDGARLTTIGDGGYSDGIRARLIRDRLLATARATPSSMLDVQLESGSLFLDRWRALVLEALGSRDAAAEQEPARTPARQEFKRLVETTWTGKASPDSVGYRLVRAFRTEVVRVLLTSLTAPALVRDPSFDYTRSPRSEGPVWPLVSQRPMHLLPPEFVSWPALFEAAVDTVIADLTSEGRTLAGRTWGEANRAQIAHPLASAVPMLGRFLTMPADPLPGDVYTPRAQTPRTGASERLVVSPGREFEGLLHMPTGQSAHPLSPHFGDMQRAWVEGTPVPLLPGSVVHTLTLTP